MAFPQKLTLIEGFTPGLLPLPLTVQTGPCGDFSEQSRLRPRLLRVVPTAPLTTGVGYRQLVPRPPSCIPRPSYSTGVGTAAEGAPQASWAHWEGHQTLVLGLLQGPGSGVQASLKVRQHLACAVSLGSPPADDRQPREGQSLASSSSTPFIARIRLEFEGSSETSRMRTCCDLASLGGPRSSHVTKDVHRSHRSDSAQPPTLQMALGPTQERPQATGQRMCQRPAPCAHDQRPPARRGRKQPSPPLAKENPLDLTSEDLCA